MEIVNKKLEELIVPDYNPRKISPKQRDDIKKSLEEYGFVQPLVVNVNPERMNIVIGGSQRKAIAQSMGFVEAPCYEVNLNEADEKKLNLRLNKNQAEFDYDLLEQFFDKDMLFDVGFSQDDFGAVMEEFNETVKRETAHVEPQYPIVQKFNEKYSTVMIFCDNEMDFNWLRNVLNLQKMRDYKNSRIGESCVITVKDFQKVWADATHTSDEDEDFDDMEEEYNEVNDKEDGSED